LRSAVAGLVLLIALAATAQPPAQNADELARRFIELTRHGDLEATRDLFDPDVLPWMEANALLLLQHAMQRMPDAEVRFVHREILDPQEGRPSERRVYQLRDESESLLLLIRARSDDGGPVLTHVEWQPAPLDLRERFPFVLDGIPPPHLAALATASAIALLTFYALALCVRERGRLWWLWAPAIPISAGKLQLIWLQAPFHTGYLQFDALSMHWFGVWLEKAPAYDPWRLMLWFPLGALAFLASRGIARSREA